MHLLFAVLGDNRGSGCGDDSRQFMEKAGAMSNGTGQPGGLAGFLGGIFQQLGSSFSQQTAAISDTATQAFYIVAGELAVVIVLLTGIFITLVSRRR